MIELLMLACLCDGQLKFFFITCLWMTESSNNLREGGNDVVACLIDCYKHNCERYRL